MKLSNSLFSRSILGIICILSIILYFLAPKEYSYTFCILCLSIFVFTNIILLKNNCKKTIINFEFFFFIAYAFTYYVYPVFHYMSNPYFLLFSLPFNENYISSGIALANVGYSFYSFGVFDNNRSFFDNKANDFIKTRSYSFFSNRKLKDSSLILCVLLFIYIPRLIQLVLIGNPTKEFETSFINVLIQYVLYYVIIVKFNNYSVFIKSKGILNFYKRNYFIVTLIFIYISLLILLGSRTIPLRIILLFLLLYNFNIFRLSKKTVILLLVFGGISFFAIGILRNPDVAAETSSMNVNPILKVGNELVINNRSLYVLMEQKDLNGINFGQTLLMYVLSIIPFMQSTFLLVTGWSVSDISSASFVTELYYGNKPSLDVVGLGTNIIGDIYISFGFLGVILLMYLGGVWLKKLYREICLKHNIVALIFYSVLFMDVIYLSRSSYLVSLRGLVWIYLLYIFLNNIKSFKNQ